MSENAAAGAQVEDAYRVLLRRSLLVGGIAALVCVVVAAVLRGLDGALSAGLGALLVLVFFGARLLVMRRTARSNPQMVLVAALGVYTVKIVLLGLAMVFLSRLSWVVGPALGLSVIVCAVCWLAAEMRAFVKLRVPVFAASTPAASAPAADARRDGGS
ncbi:hypothetical protein GTQ99_19870 [Kineococcus sp. T13]|uniref:hypothetical protein n=1 Tax=Kineococcus vitellinus TaxID=2696565 RepID=UPI001412540A|nr:hypothetical protein [Kineococcus vitellinus]NAZ77650.1 hypothetical protein [Kineococcus vitellinus]